MERQDTATLLPIISKDQEEKGDHNYLRLENVEVTYKDIKLSLIHI